MKRFLFSVLVCWLAVPFFAAESARSGTVALPAGIGGIALGMSLDEVKAALKKNHEFGYRGDRDVSFSPSDGQTLIETDGRWPNGWLKTDTSIDPPSYFERCWFQFVDGKLYIITVNLNQKKIDYYSIFKTLCEKYGKPDQLSPRKSQWSDENVLMSVERPLSLKYIDAKTFNERQEAANVQKTIGEQNRDAFLDGL
ncbi:MAG: hypothetical protein K2J81_09155 [Treponemataceae bacterium]|nr:hypothetical protein [Treponemataceae bacterium]